MLNNQFRWLPNDDVLGGNSGWYRSDNNSLVDPGALVHKRIPEDINDSTYIYTNDAGFIDLTFYCTNYQHAINTPPTPTNDVICNIRMRNANDGDYGVESLNILGGDQYIIYQHHFVDDGYNIPGLTNQFKTFSFKPAADYDGLGHPTYVRFQMTHRGFMTQNARIEISAIDVVLHPRFSKQKKFFFMTFTDPLP